LNRAFAIFRKDPHRDGVVMKDAGGDFTDARKRLAQIQSSDNGRQKRVDDGEASQAPQLVVNRFRSRRPRCVRHAMWQSVAQKTATTLPFADGNSVTPRGLRT
jgi:hypothetical protein